MCVTKTDVSTSGQTDCALQRARETFPTEVATPRGALQTIPLSPEHLKLDLSHRMTFGWAGKGITEAIRLEKISETIKPNLSPTPHVSETTALCYVQSCLKML